jgi:serine/threonine-protein kinase
MITIPLLTINNVDNGIFHNIDQKVLAAETITMKRPGSPAINNITDMAVINSTETNFSVYENPTYGFKIIYPANWDKLEFSQNNANGLVAGFTLPREGKPQSEINVSDFILENVIIGVKTIPFTMLSSPKDTILNDFVDEQISSYKDGLTNFQIIKFNTTNSIDNNPASQIQYIHKDGRATFDTLQAWVINGNKIYTILFNADPADYSTYLPIIQKMIDSFVILKNSDSNKNNDVKFRST